MRTPTGDCRVDFFNKYGERIRGVELQALALKDCHWCPAERLKEPGMLGASYTIMRTIFNSLDD